MAEGLNGWDDVNWALRGPKFQAFQEDNGIAFSAGISAVEGERRNEFAVDIIGIRYWAEGFVNQAHHEGRCFDVASFGAYRRLTDTTRLGYSKSPDGIKKEYRISELASVPIWKPDIAARLDLMLGLTAYTETVANRGASAGGDLDYGFRFFIIRPEPDDTELFLSTEAAGAIGLRGDINGGDHSDGFRARWRLTASAGLNW